MQIRQSNYVMLILFCIVVMSIIFAVFILSLDANLLPSYSEFAMGEAAQQRHQQPNIKASGIYQNYTMVLGKDIKNLVIVIPNEGHEQPNQNPEMRIVNQPYLPQHAVVNVGTTIIWYNTDHAHRHRITLVDNNNNSKNVIYQTNNFKNFTGTKPITFNTTGSFNYSGPSFDRAFPNYVMNGTITVINQPLNTSFNSSSTAAITTTTTTTTTNTTSTAATAGAANNINTDTIAALMVPANLRDKVTSELKGQGFGIDNQYPFTSLRGGDSAAGKDRQQVLLVLTSSGKNLREVVSALKTIVPTIPYE